MSEAPCAKGDTVRLKFMGADPDPIAVGTIGEVVGVTDLQYGEWQISMKWESGRTLSMICPPDEFEVVT